MWVANSIPIRESVSHPLHYFVLILNLESLYVFLARLLIVGFRLRSYKSIAPRRALRRRPRRAVVESINTPILTRDYIIPGIPPPPIGGITGASLFCSTSTHSVVRNIAAIDAAFSNATRDTFVGSMIPAANISS